MLVKELMKTDVAACAPTDTLADIAKLMRDRNCGFIPVVNHTGAVVGIVTDRDVGLAAGGSTRTAERISAAEVMSQPVFGCFADENVKTVLATMSAHHVRRLPVLEKEHGHIVGILSLDDVAKAPHRRGGPTAEDVADTLKRIVSPRPISAAM
ncbi:MAG TPA: CBS domain-containing protein [Vicinamibacterales bacterium]|nr:CBS domain-containing protein [Vicinamibacterales bacterium]